MKFISTRRIRPTINATTANDLEYLVEMYDGVFSDEFQKALTLQLGLYAHRNPEVLEEVRESRRKRFVQYREYFEERYDSLLSSLESSPPEDLEELADEIEKIKVLWKTIGNYILED